MYITCEECPFFNMVDFNPVEGTEVYDCTVSTPEDAAMMGMWCKHFEERENLET